MTDPVPPPAPPAAPGLPIGQPSLRFWSQRIDGRPFVNCLPYSICPVLQWMGYVVPDDYGMQLRIASGVVVVPGRGTSYADMKRAFDRILPTAPVVYGAAVDDDLIAMLPQRKKPKRGNVLSVVARMERLPTHLRRLVGYRWQGLHAITIAQRRRAPDGTWLVYWMDPMGRTYRGYEGEWVAWSDVAPALRRNDAGLIRFIAGKRGTAV